MNPRVILYAIVGGLLTVYGLWLLSVGDYIWGVALLVIGVLNGVQMIRLAMLSEDRRN